MTPAVRDQYDRVVSEAVDLWEGRAGVAMSLAQLAPLFSRETVVTLANFFVPGALGDRNAEVRNKMLEAAMAVVNCHGKVSHCKIVSYCVTCRCNEKCHLLHISL